MKFSALFYAALPTAAVATHIATQDVDPLYEEHRFALPQTHSRELREFDEHGRRLLTRTLEWPECKGMDVWDCKSHIEEYIARFEGHVLKDMELIVRQPRVQPVFDDSYYFNGVRSNMEVIGQSACDRFNGATLHRNRDNSDWSWFYANGTKYTVPDLDCSGKTNAECCDIIWEHGEWMGLDKDGRHLTCYVLQEPSYPFFDERDRNLLKYPDYYNNESGECRRKNYRPAALQRQYNKVAKKIVSEFIVMIDHLYGPAAFPGRCIGQSGKRNFHPGLVILQRGGTFGPLEGQKQRCLDMCIKHEQDTGEKLTACEALWGNHKGRGCYGHTEEVVRDTGGNFQDIGCFLDPVREETGKLKCADLKTVIDNGYNYARMIHLNEIMGQVQFEYYDKFCSNGEEELDSSEGLKTLLMEAKRRATFRGEVEVVNFVYIVGGLDGIVTSVPRVASNNPALNPILWNSPA